MNTDKGYIIVFDDEKLRLKYRTSLIRQTNTVLGICEQLRFTYDSIIDMKDVPLKERLTEQLTDVLIMAKKMDKRLNYYYKKYSDTSGHNASRLVRLQHNSRRIRMRRVRPI
jgi:hypothetical protein